MSSTTSRTISSSWSKASASSVKLTMPSIEFSIGTNPASASPFGHGVEHVGHGAVGQQLCAGEVGLCAQRLLGERAERAEERDPLRRRAWRACRLRSSCPRGYVPSGVR